jgi:hypothetical protein
MGDLPQRGTVEEQHLAGVWQRVNPSALNRVRASHDAQGWACAIIAVAGSMRAKRQLRASTNPKLDRPSGLICVNARRRLAGHGRIFALGMSIDA